MAHKLTDTELQKRLQLQELFKKNMSDFSLKTPDDFVSLFPPKEIKKDVILEPKITLSKKEIKERFGKPCFEPVVMIDETDLNSSQSKYFGNVWISNDETWPTDSYGDYLTFVLQLNIETLPGIYCSKLGGKGILQFFYAVGGVDINTELVRIVYPNSNGKYTSQPLNKNPHQNYKINHQLPQQKIITDWKMHIDLPHYEEVFDDQTNQFLETLENREDICAIKGDKLGGYASFSQQGCSSDNLIFQLDAESHYQGKDFKSHAPELFATDGTGHIFHDPYGNMIMDADEDSVLRNFFFDWSCG